MNKNSRQIRKEGETGHSEKLKKQKQKGRGKTSSINRKAIKTTQNHNFFNGSMKQKSTHPSVLHHNSRPLLRTILIVALYLIAFIILDFITRQYEDLPGIVPWYPPVGFTYAFLFVFGVSFTPAVTIALFISSLFVYRMPQPVYLLFLWAIIISLVYSAATLFLRRVVHFDWQLRKFRDVISFVFTMILVSALLSVLSVSSSALSGNISKNEILQAIFQWWIGETVGVLTVTPFLLLFVMPGLKRFM